jgi:hypothetical protein
VLILIFKYIHIYIYCSSENPTEPIINIDGDQYYLNKFEAFPANYTSAKNIVKLALSINNLKATSTTIFNKTNFTNLLVSGASTVLSSLNVSCNIVGSGTALTNLNFNAILNRFLQ